MKTTHSIALPKKQSQVISVEQPWVKGDLAELADRQAPAAAALVPVLDDEGLGSRAIALGGYFGEELFEESIIPFCAFEFEAV